MRTLRPGAREQPDLVTGGAGFIGANLAHRLCSSGRRVLVLDNLSRPGVEANLEWLQLGHPDRLTFVHGDVRDPDVLRELSARAGRVFHLAAQVAVTSSLTDPVHDFEVNARGSLNLLEALRSLRRPPPLLYTSTNKVYGDLADLALSAHGTNRYEPEDPELRRRGIGEQRPLELHSPYGCSKGAADQYVLDYARTLGLPAVVFRMSCVYGPRQFGTEDQGWVAHFLLSALRGQPITVYGDGRQVRDLLYVDDLVDAMLAAFDRMPALSGQAFNIGGGPARSASLLEVIARMRALGLPRPELRFAPARPADQRYYVSDTARFQRATGWSPRVDLDPGLGRLLDWLEQAGGAGLVPLAGRYNSLATEALP